MLEGFTTGPLIASAAGNQSYVKVAASIGLKIVAQTFVGCDVGAREAQANARLFAAAPKLLESVRFVLPSLIEACEFLDNGTPICNGSELHSDLLAARDLINKIDNDFL